MIEALTGSILVKPIGETLTGSLLSADLEKITQTLRQGTDRKTGKIVYFIDGTYEKNDQRINQDEFTHEGQLYIHVKEDEIRLFL